MKTRTVKIRIEGLREGDIDPSTGRPVVAVIDRKDIGYVRGILKGTWSSIGGYYGKVVEVIRERKEVAT